MKKKLRLQVEKLSVERFEVHPNLSGARGTVRGFETDPHTTCLWKYCFDVPGTQYLEASDCC